MEVSGCSGPQLSPTVSDPWTAALQAFLSFTISWSLLKLMSIESMMPSTHLILCCPFSSCLRSFPTSGFFQWVRSLHQVAKVSDLQLQHQSFQWIFRTDFLYDWLVGSPCNPRDSQESLLQHHSSKASILWYSSLLYGPALTPIHDYWKNHSFLWLYGPLSVKYYLCFLIYCQGLL